MVIDVSSVQPGKRVEVRLNEGISGKKVKGTFVASDADGVTVRAKDGQELTVPWYKVRKLAANRKVKLQLEPGMNAGAIIDQGAPRKRRFLAVQN